MVVTSNRAGEGSSAGLGLGMRSVSFHVEGVAGRARVRARSACDGVGGDVVERLGGVGDHVDAVALHAEGCDRDREVDRGDVVFGEPADPRDSGLGVGPAAVTQDIDEAGAAGVCHLELLAEQLDRVAGERGPAAGLDPGHERQRPRPVGEQRGAVAEQGGGAASADLSEAVGEDPADRPERVLVCAHRAGGVDHQPDVRLLDRRGDLPGDPPRVGADGPSGLPLRLAAGVGAAVEPPAGRALVDPPGAVRQRLAQAGRVAAGVLDLVGRGGSVDAAVGHPAGRHPGPAP